MHFPNIKGNCCFCFSFIYLFIYFFVLLSLSLNFDNFEVAVNVGSRE